MKGKKRTVEYKVYSERQIENMQKKVAYLGIDSNTDPIKLLNIRLMSSILVFFVVLYFLSFGYLLAPIIAFLVYVLFIPIVLDTKINEKRKVLEQDALYFFEVFALSNFVFKVLVAIPFIIFVLIYFMDPTYFVPLIKEPLGNLILVLIILIYIIYIILVKKIVKIREW